MRNTKLRVKKPSSTRRFPLSESQFEAKIAKILSDLNILSYHVNEKVYVGIPDRYVAGGRWIEFKQCMIVKSVSPCRFVSMAQRRRMDEFLAAGDQPYLCMLFQFRYLEEPRALLLPWQDFQGKYTVDNVKAIAYIEDDWERMVKEQLL